MAATVLNAVQSTVQPGLHKTVVTIPTTVDGTSGATCDFSLPRAYAISIQAVSTNFNGKAVVLQAGPDGVNFAALPTTAISISATGMASVAAADTAFVNYRVSINGAPTAALTVTIYATQWK